MNDDRPDLDAIEARAATATPGPWEARGVGSGYEITCVRALVPDGAWKRLAQLGYGNHSPAVTPQELRDAAFIAAARADVTALVAYARRLDAELATLHALLDAVGDALGQHPGEVWDDLPTVVRRVSSVYDAAVRHTRACRCRGTGRYEGTCRYCGDSTSDHECVYPVYMCTDRVCSAVRAATATESDRG